MQRRRVMLAAGKKPRLPREYQEVKWLKSSGTQYIDTGIILTQDDEVELLLVLTQISIGGVFGSRIDAKTANIGCGYQPGGNGLFVDFGDYTNTRAKIISPNLNEEYTILTNKNTRTIKSANDSTIAANTYVYTNTFSTPTGINIFRQEGWNNPGICGKIEWVKIITNGSQHLFIPCYRKSNNKPGMYDLCGSICPLTNSPFYINAGTGEFLVGPDVN